MVSKAGTTSAERRKMISRARELADSGAFSDWNSVEKAMRLGNELCRDQSSFDDYDLRRELDARCSAARRKKAAQEDPSA
jgi:hypothetical protein